MKKMFALVAVVGLAASASADPLQGTFRWEVRAGSSGPWSSAISINAGDAYQVRATASWTDIVGTTSIGFAGATFSQINFAGADATDTLGGATGGSGSPTFATRVQGTAETWTLQAGTGTSAGGLKIDNVTPTSNVNFGQLPQILPGGSSNPNFLAANPLVVFLMDAVAGDAAAARVVSISSDWIRLPPTNPSNQFTVYTSATGTSKKGTTEATRVDAAVTILPVPAPASMALIGLGGLVAGRRRR